MRQYTTDDFGYYARRYYSGGVPTAPDMDASLHWDFYDADGVLQFSATPSSTPPIEIGTDSVGPYAFVTDLPLSVYPLGIVEVDCFANVAGVPTEPSPEHSTAFEVISGDLDPGTCGYCSVQDVIEATGVVKKDLDFVDDALLKQSICRWIGEVSDLIDKYCRTSWDIGLHPLGIRRAAIDMTSNVVQIAIQRRKGPYISMTEYSAKMVEDLIFTDHVKKILDGYRLKVVISDDADATFAISSFIAEEQE